MRYIEKTSSPTEFEIWKAKRNADWEPMWDNFSNPEKKIVKKALLREQGYLCCYCGTLLDKIEQVEIEHIIPRTDCKTEDGKLDYNNFLGSCTGSRVDPPPRHLTCNAKRQDKKLLVKPTDPECGDHFVFSEDGYIHGTTEEGDQTIDVLGLHIEKFNLARQAAIRPFLDIELSEAKSIKKQFESLEQDTDGEEKFKNFSFVVLNYFSQRFGI